MKYLLLIFTMYSVIMGVYCASLYWITPTWDWRTGIGNIWYHDSTTLAFSVFFLSLGAVGIYLIEKLRG